MLIKGIERKNSVKSRVVINRTRVTVTEFGLSELNQIEAGAMCEFIVSHMHVSHTLFPIDRFFLCLCGFVYADETKEIIYSMGRN